MSAPRKEPRQKRSQFTFDTILDAAARLFEEDGYKTTTTNKIAELAGVSIGTLYHYLPNKDALLYALARRHYQRSSEWLRSRFATFTADDPSLADTVRQLVTEMAHRHNQEPHLNRLLHLQAQRNLAGAQESRTLEAEFTAALESQLRRMNIGGPDPYVTAMLVVQGIDAQMHGGVIDLPPGRTIEDVIDIVSTMWIGALVATGPPTDPAIAP
ncbi:TetR/AcrR family transcriptional regulator [Nocardia altamirensis]|uniref:TetR/AcrR family transcriptional regulator n=1 Tax=Nocardia altamirensis TaxID=472158 RepID=UPI0008404401|nr:TetR/AcrR family transcriptional regulator [Nocardia altamirensis]